LKNKIKKFLGLFIFLIIQDTVLGINSLYLKNNLSYYSNNVSKGKNYNEILNSYKIVSESEKNKVIKYENNNFEIPSHLRKFFHNLLVNLDNNSIIQNKNNIEVDLLADNKKFIGAVFSAEGNVIIRTNNSVLSSDKFSYDQDLEIMIIKGDIKFKSENSYLEASDIKYDFKNKKGFILNVYGSIDFQNLSKISVSSKSNNVVDENFKDLKEPKEVKFNNSSNIKLGNILRKYDDKQSFAKRLTNQALEVNFNPIVNTRFIAKKIDINDNIWFSESLTITNDPFGEPQLIIKNRKFRTTFNEENTKIRSKWSTAVLDDKLTIPLGPRRIDVDKSQNFKWGNGYDKTKYDGFYLFRRFNKIKFNDSNNTELDVTSFFPIQRIITGKTSAFPNNNDLVISPKVKKDAKFFDYLGISAFLKSDWDNSKFITRVNTNSLDFDKLDKAIEFESFFTINLFNEESENHDELTNEQEKEPYKFIDGFTKSKDLTFFGSYRDKTKNGSLGEIAVKSAYGVRYDVFKNSVNNDLKIFSERTFSIGNYESSSRLDSGNLVNRNRLNLSFKKGYEFPIWKLEVDEFINKSYKYSPVVIPQGLYWGIEGNVDFFRYEDGDMQDLFQVKTGPKLIIGEFKDNFLDYTELSIIPRFRFNRGKSPFNFDQIVDNKVIELKASQQIYGPLLMNFSAEISLDKKESNNDALINPVLDLSWNRRAYAINLFYNLDSEIGGLNFKINTFNFKGFGKSFDN
tara:strand:+ start:7090 stop:9312 length:2223 start_codon:yes stop_codon:yes gene_type:complete